MLIARPTVPGEAKVLTLADWLDEEIYHSFGFSLTRGDVLWKVRDKEGVAHFDKKIPASSGYSALLDKGPEDLVWTWSKGGTVTLISKVTEPPVFLHVLKEAPLKGSPPPELVEKEFPLTGGVDATLRTMATELLAALATWQTKAST